MEELLKPMNMSQKRLALSLGVPAIKCLKGKAGRAKTEFILDAIDERPGLAGNREELIRKPAGTGPA